MRRLKEFEKLDTIFLGGTQITDAGFLKLKAMGQLTRIYIPNTGITEKAIQELKRSLPNCEIIP